MLYEPIGLFVLSQMLTDLHNRPFGKEMFWVIDNIKSIYLFTDYYYYCTEWPATSSCATYWCLCCFVQTRNRVCVVSDVIMEPEYCRDMLSSQRLLPAIRNTASDVFVIQPTHWARQTVAPLNREMTVFIRPDLWPPSSHALKPVDYVVWDHAATRVPYPGIHNIRRHRTESSIWSSFGLVCNKKRSSQAADTWRRRLHAFVTANGRHCEHLLRLLSCSDCVSDIQTVTCVLTFSMHFQWLWTVLWFLHFI